MKSQLSRFMTSIALFLLLTACGGGNSNTGNGGGSNNTGGNNVAGNWDDMVWDQGNWQ